MQGGCGFGRVLLVPDPRWSPSPPREAAADAPATETSHGLFPHRYGACVTSTLRAAILLAVPAILALGACAGPAGAGDPAQPTAIATWSEPAGIAPELVYVTGIEGFELAPQSVGVMGDNGMSAIYVRAGGGGGTVMLTTSRDTAPNVVPCAKLPDSPEPEPVLRCAVERGHVHVTLEGVDVEAATMRAAAEGVRAPSADELGPLFADVPTAQTPVERGDLPPKGDGAPLDQPGAGG